MERPLSPSQRTMKPSRRRRRSCLIRTLATLVSALGITIAAALIAGWVIFYRPVNPVEPGQPVQISISSGSSTGDIAAQLSEAGVVANPNMFRLQSRIEGADGKLRAGVYDLSTGMPYDLVIRKLVEGPPINYTTVTIPEGFVIDQIAARLEKQAGIPAEEFLALARGGAGQFQSGRPYLATTYGHSLEGYLFPKTYRIKEGSTASDVIEMMLRQFDSEIADIGITADGANGRSLNDIVTIASMIERETKVARERPIVSSVIYNRLRKGMRLEIDATIEYVLPGNRFRLRYSDLRIDSPYNTYRNKGLPPGPIANPGADALKAAAYPDRTNYVYYVLTGKDGTHTFATNEADFQRAKQKSKEVFGR